MMTVTFVIFISRLTKVLYKSQCFVCKLRLVSVKSLWSIKQNYWSYRLINITLPIHVESACIVTIQECRLTTGERKTDIITFLFPNTRSSSCTTRRSQRHVSAQMRHGDQKLCSHWPQILASIRCCHTSQVSLLKG